MLCQLSRSGVVRCMVLLWCFTWHLALPAAALTDVEPAPRGSVQWTASQHDDSSECLVNSSETQEAVRVSQRDRLRLPLPRLLCALAPQTRLQSAGSSLWRLETFHRLTYPARSRLHHARASGRGDEPAA